MLYKKIQKGFTITEMLVTISIIGIMAAMIVPTLSHYLPGIQLNGSARSLNSDLRNMQEHAITEQKQYSIKFFPSTSPPTYKLLKIDNSVIPPTEEEIRTVNLPSNCSLTLAPTISQDEIIFSADGGPSSAGDITITLNSVNKILNVSPAGFIKISN